MECNGVIYICMYILFLLFDSACTAFIQGRPSKKMWGIWGATSDRVKVPSTYTALGSSFEKSFEIYVRNGATLSHLGIYLMPINPSELCDLG